MVNRRTGRETSTCKCSGLIKVIGATRKTCRQRKLRQQSAREHHFASRYLPGSQSARSCITAPEVRRCCRVRALEEYRNPSCKCSMRGPPLGLACNSHPLHVLTSMATQRSGALAHHLNVIESPRPAASPSPRASSIASRLVALYAAPGTFCVAANGTIRSKARLVPFKCQHCCAASACAALIQVLGVLILP